MKKIIIIVLCVLVAAVGLRFLTYQFQGWQEAQKRKNAPAPSVVVKEIETKDVIRKFEAPARVVSVSRINVVARISGYLTKSYFKEGDIVKKGQVLFEIEPQEYKLAADKAKANLANSEAQLTYYEKQLKRAAELVKQDYIAKSQYDQTLAQRDSYRAQVALNKSAYQDALRNLSYTKVTAPVDGQVGMMQITVGNYVSAQSGPLTTLNSINPIYVSFPMETKNYSELVKVDKVQDAKRKVDLYFSSGKQYKYVGIQDFHDNNVDVTTGSIMMRATFENPDGALINGDYVTVYLYSNEKENLPVVPQVAVMENPQYKYVYKLDAKGLPQIQKIETMGQDGLDWIVKSGLNAGDKVIVSGLQAVIPGNKVRVMSDEEVQKMKQQQEEEKQSIVKEEKQ